MTANEFVCTECFSRKHAAAERARDAGQKLLAVVAVSALTASIIFIGIFMAVLAQTVPAINLVSQARLQ